MINLLNNITTRVKGTIRFPEWEYVRDGLTMNLSHANKYYRNSAYAVGSDHGLIKLLYGLFTSVDVELFEFYKRVDAKALTVAQQLGYTTVMSRGSPFSNYFFGKDSTEVIIVTDESFDPVEVTNNWRDAQPIKVLKHGFDLIDCFPLNGKLSSTAVSVFTINLPMLAVQYRAFRQWQSEMVNKEIGRAPITHFLYSYPINNMIFSAMDYAMFNRMVRIRNGIETSDNITPHPFHMTNFTRQCDRILLAINESLNGSKPDLGNVAMTIPLVTLTTTFNLIKVPDIAESRNVNWAIYLARIDMLLFLLSFEGVDKQSTAFINSLKYELKTYLNDGTIKTALGRDLFQTQKEVIEQFISA